jgi:hypothetical protein
MVKDDYPCLPPPDFLRIYDELWDRAFGRGKPWVYESTCGGMFSLRRRSFRGVLKDERALDDILMLDRLFSALSRTIHAESNRHEDAAEWHRDIKKMIGVWKEKEKERAKSS